MVEGDLCFLHQILCGVAERSHAIEVARIAGIPLEVLDLATVHLESK